MRKMRSGRASLLRGYSARRDRRQRSGENLEQRREQARSSSLSSSAAGRRSLPRPQFHCPAAVPSLSRLCPAAFSPFPLTVFGFASLSRCPAAPRRLFPCSAAGSGFYPDPAAAKGRRKESRPVGFRRAPPCTSLSPCFQLSRGGRNEKAARGDSVSRQ